jgi:uncharacterized protein YndB with AHSA1/START domain
MRGRIAQSRASNGPAGSDTPNVATRGYAHRIDIDADIDNVWTALTSSGLLERWLSPDARIRPKSGGSFFAMPAPGLARDALIDVFEPPRRLRLLYLPPPHLPGFDGAVADDYLLESAGGGTIVRLLGSGLPDLVEWDTHYRQVRVASERALARLKVLVEQLERGEAPGKEEG